MPDRDRVEELHLWVLVATRPFPKPSSWYRFDFRISTIC